MKLLQAFNLKQVSGNVDSNFVPLLFESYGKMVEP